MSASPEFIRDTVIPQFPLDGEFVSVAPYGSGHINDTFAANFRLADGSTKRYLLQRINTKVFQDPDGLMENIMGVTAFLRKIIQKQGGDPERETLTVIPAKSGKPYYRDADNGCWRVYIFIEYTIYQKSQARNEKILRY